MSSRKSLVLHQGKTHVFIEELLIYFFVFYVEFSGDELVSAAAPGWAVPQLVQANLERKAYGQIIS
jgi:hypothetical protein